MTSQHTRTLTVWGSSVVLGVAIGLMFWPIVSRADTAPRRPGAARRDDDAVPGDPGQHHADLRARRSRDGWTEGFAKGLGMSILRPPIGVYELVTAPFPAPWNFEPILEPEYPWSYFGSGEGGDEPGLARR